MSRTYLRAGLAQLEAEGKIWRAVGQGTFVGARPIQSAADITLLSGLASPAEVMEVRLVIEPETARLAALRATPGDIAHLEHCLRKSLAAPDFTTYAKWDATLHRGIAEAAHNTLLFTLFDAVNAVREQKGWSRLWEGAMTPQRETTYNSHHHQIVRAIAERNAAHAEGLMRRHLEAVQKNLLRKAAATGSGRRTAAV